VLVVRDRRFLPGSKVGERLGITMANGLEGCLVTFCNHTTEGSFMGLDQQIGIYVCL